MKRILKWFFITAVSLPVLIIAALFMIPFFVDIEQYRPQIESRISEITERPFTLGGDIRLSLFPWAGLSLSDIRMGNPPGFETTDFLSVKSFEVRVDFLPLLSKDIRINRLSLKNPMITLERNRKGVGNWKGPARTEKEKQPQEQKKQTPSNGSLAKEWSLGSLTVKTFTLSEGVLLWIDQPRGERREIRDLTMELQDLSVALNGAVLIKALKIQGANIQDVRLKLMGKNGLFHMKLLGMKLYGGEVTGNGSLNLTQDAPRAQVQLKADGIRVGPLIRDILEKDIMEGAFATDLRIDAAGNSNDAIKKSLHGEGTLRFTDGVINGIDLPAMLQNTGGTSGLSDRSDRTARTSYSEFTIPFTITDGIVQTTETTLTSPLLKVQVSGQADITEKTLDFRIEPRFLAPLNGQGDAEKRKGLTIPVLVGGTFSSPLFIPDLDAVLKQNFGKELKGLSELQKGLLESGKKDGKDSRIDKIRDFLNNLR